MGVCRTTVMTVGATNNVSPNNKRNNKSNPSRGKSRQNASSVEQKVVSMYSPRRTYPPQEIPDVQNTVRVTKITTLYLRMEQPNSVDLTVAKVASSIPGGTTYWARMRISKVNVWMDMGPGTTSSTTGPVPLTVTLPSSNTWSQPAISWTDSGIVGQSRACVGFKLGLLDQARWFGTAATDVICTLSSGSNRSATVQVTVELMSPA
jgi:hypothetical protein